MGLLDDEDKALAISSGLLSGRGSAGLGAAMSNMAALKGNKIKEDLLKMQIANFQSEIGQRDLAGQKSNMILDLVRKGMAAQSQNSGMPSGQPPAQGLLGDPAQAASPTGQMPTGAPSPGMPSGGMQLPGMQPGAPAAPSAMPPTQNMAAPMSGVLNENKVLGMGLDGVNALSALGVNLLENYKYANDPMKLSAGDTYQDRVKGGRITIPLLTPGQQFNDGQISNIPGAVNSAAEAAGATARATEGAKAGSELVQVYDPVKKVMTFVPRAQALAASGGGMPSQVPGAPQGMPPMPQPQPGGQSGLTGNFQGPVENVMAQINGIKNPQERANATRAYANQMTRNQPSGPMMAAAPTGDVNAAAADKEYGTQVAKDQVEQRKSIMTAGFTAASKIAKFQQIGKLMEDFEGGKLSGAAMDFASAANSLGIKIDKNLPNKEAAVSMSRGIALSLRDPSGGAGMPGSMSDGDRGYLTSMAPGLEQTAAGRKQIIQAGIAVETRNQQVADFARKYEGKHGKLDNGFYAQLSAWSSQNPLFGDKK